MALNAAILDSGLAAIHADLPETATIGGSSVAVNRVSLSSHDMARQSAEVLTNHRVSLSVAATALSNAAVSVPSEGDTLTYNATVLRVLAVEHSAEGQDVRLHLGDRYTAGMR